MRALTADGLSLCGADGGASSAAQEQAERDRLLSEAQRLEAERAAAAAAAAAGGDAAEAEPGPAPSREGLVEGARRERVERLIREAERDIREVRRAARRGRTCPASAPAEGAGRAGRGSTAQLSAAAAASRLCARSDSRRAARAFLVQVEQEVRKIDDKKVGVPLQPLVRPGLDECKR